MIRIKPYTDLADPKKALHIYLYNVATALPFRVEDIFIEGFFWDPHTNTYKADLACFEKRFGRQPDIDVLKKTREQIFLYSDLLGKFLYTGDSLNRDQLRKLLLSPMDKESLSANGIWPIIEEVDKKKPSNSEYLLNHIFQYDHFSSSGRKGNIYEYVKLLGVEVCPYCNRMFTTTMDAAENGGKRIRPQLDHYRNKTTYPFLALSILNLVPSCAVCNQTKGVATKPILYPYQEGMGTAFRFRTKPNQDTMDLTYLVGNHKDFSVHLEKAEGFVPDDFEKRARNSMSVFGLEDIYQYHTEFISDLFFQRYVFSDDYLEEIKDTFSDWFSSIDDVKRLLFLRSIEQSEWGQRPLSKLTHDIDLEIEELQNSPYYSQNKKNRRG